MLLLIEPGATPLGDAIAAAGARRGLEVVRWTPEQIVAAVRVTFTLVEGRTDFTLRTAALALPAAALTGIHVAVDRFSPQLWPHFSPRDAGYAADEMNALWLALLACAPCPVVNPPAPEALAGAVYTPVEILAHARRAGLAVAPILYAESAAALADVELAEVRVAASDLGAWPLAEVAPTAAWQRTCAALARPVRLRGEPPGQAQRICLIGQETLLVPGCPAPPPAALDALPRLHLALGRELGEYRLRVTKDGLWSLADALREPHPDTVAELGEALGDAVVRRMQTGGRP